MTRHDLGKYGPPGNILLDSLTRAMKLVVGGPQSYPQSHTLPSLPTLKHLNNPPMARCLLFTASIPSVRRSPLRCLARYESTVVENPSKRKRSSLVNKSLLFEILRSTATKREAKSYLSRFSFPKLEASNQESPRRKGGVNLENLLLPPRAVDQNPVFTQNNSDNQFANHASESLHVALVKIRAPQELDDVTLRGVGHTLSQLTLLGLSSVVIVDCNDGKRKTSQEVRHLSIEQAGRVVGAIDYSGGQGARRLDNIIELSPLKQHAPSVKIPIGLKIAYRKFLLASLQRGVIPVIVPNGFMSGIQTVVPVDASEVLLALSREFAGIQTVPVVDESPHAVADKVKKLQAEVSLDRIILLDPLGGIPSLSRHYDSHVFINLEQEFSGIHKELSELKVDLTQTRHSEVAPFNTCRSFQRSETTAEVWEDNRETKGIESRNLSPTVTASTVQIQLENLELLRQSLTILPPSASALLTTAKEAANIEEGGALHQSQIPGVGTRRQRNPLIYNLLTDKPVFSSSLPSARSQKPPATGSDTNLVPFPATFVKRGMSVTILPDPSTHPWHPPVQSSGSVQLFDARLDLARLVHLIEDSFNRQLDVPHYMSRIGSSLAGIIIAGEYEGGALLTWETPPRKPAFSAKKVPYLDKFAVLKRSQGAGGVADIVFNAMVRNCFPGGVCWRSRTDNPVNKWYFERAKGSWKIPGSNWTMFWTTDQVEMGDDTFLDYEAVCRSVMPSWADKKAVVD